MERGHEEEDGHGPDEERQDRPPRLAGSGSHVLTGRAPRVSLSLLLGIVQWDSLLVILSLWRAFLSLYIGMQQGQPIERRRPVPYATRQRPAGLR